jgi:pilus assembly protein Flp/PilA
MLTSIGKFGTEDGQSLVEYALILLLVAVAVVAALTVFGLSLSGVYDRIVSDLPF